MADLKISELNVLSGGNLVAADELAIVDSSASETKKITVTDLVGNATTLIADATIPGAKILFGAGDIAGTAIADGGISTAKVADDAITAAKLGNESTVDLVTTLPGTGAFTGQIALDTDDNKIYIWDGSAWQSVKGAGSVNVVNGSTAGIVNIATSTSGDTVTITTSLDNTTAAKQFLAGPTGAAGAVAYRIIEGTDLPVAGASQTGGVQVSGDGLRMDTGKIEIDNDVTATGGSYKIVDVNAKGLVTGYKDIESADLPIATDATPGVVSPGSDLDVSAAGVLNHEEKIAGGGTFTKVTVNATGHITAGTTLAEADVPSLNASKIGAGAFPTARVADDAITGAKLADYSISKIAESAPTAEYIGQLFFNPLDRTLFMWDGNVYQPIGVSYGQVIFSGTYSAGTNLITSITPDGAAIGLAVGASLVSPVAANRSHYVVVDEAGTGSAPAPAVSLSPPDILLSTGSDWVLLDVSDTVTAQLASNVQVTPAGNISSTNVQAALQELDTEKLQLTGGTLTGDLNLGVDVNVTFEGANANQYETTLTVTDPTADNTVTIPDESGTVVTTGSSGVVTSTMITNGTIVDADINASAEIAVSKLVDGAARQLLQTDAAGTGVEWASNIDIPGTLDVTGAATFDGTASFPLGTAALPSLYPGSDTNTGIYSPGADQLAISTNGTQRLAIDGSGNVGIGTTSPSNNLHVYSTSNVSARFESSTSASRIRFKDPSGDAFLGNVGDNLAFYTSSSLTERARIDSSGNVGIGTSSPSKKLEIANGDVRLTDGYTISWGDDTYRIFRNGSQLRFDTNGSQALTIDSSGRVGIGTTAPGNTFHVVSSSSAVARIESTATESNIRFKNSSADNAFFGTTAGDNFFWYSGGSERMRIDSSGRLLVGTSSARSNFFNSTNSSTFQLEGQLNDAATASIVQCYNANTQGATLVLGKSNTLTVGANALVADGHTLGRVSYQGNDGNEFVEAASISAQVDGTPGANDMPGRLVFSTTADGASSPTERMRIDSSGGIGALTNTGAYFRTSAATTATLNTLAVAAAATNTTNGTNTFVVEARGNVYNQNNSYGSLSDLKLKKNIVDSNSQWDDLKALQVRNYNFKEGQTDTQIGLIAQEVELVSPGLVSESPDRDEDGNDLGTVTKSVNYSVLYMKAVKALQEAMERIETLEQRLTDAGIA